MRLFLSLAVKESKFFARFVKVLRHLAEPLLYYGTENIANHTVLPLSLVACPLYHEIMSPDDIRQQIELAVVELIKEKTAQNLMTEERSQEISQRVLDTLQPGMDLESLYKAIAKLDDGISELSPIVIPYLRQYELNVTQNAQHTMQNMIKQGNFEEASNLAHKVINQDVKLVWEGRAAYQPAPPPPPKPGLRLNPFKKP